MKSHFKPPADALAEPHNSGPLSGRDARSPVIDTPMPPPAAAEYVNRMLREAKPIGPTFYCGEWDYYMNALNGSGESVCFGIDAGDAAPEMQIIVTDMHGNSQTYQDFDTAMQAVSWQNIVVTIARFRDQLEAIGREMARVVIPEWRRLGLLPPYIPIIELPPPRPAHHAHLIERHVNRTRKPTKADRLRNGSQRRSNANLRVWKPQRYS
jgi:hypothetical protein